ncbi:sterol desaturase family protein [Aliiglaciecola sp. CAU 1673]|uniref:sterol desaturase family protein n=1 Tax=Aliiglaciecola sp. CAU 1673 TaxID=3032595 RepID=UPI0023DA0333|nr:sterol desaturase family protein [Aliiglaciecola sp. CAU 1673]MDF2179683.1 sterol desaturase family protein [Aliiglaciecola sp. CAU 1673]
MSYILIAVPFFFLLIVLELVLEKVRGTQYYRVNDAINSLSAGVLSRVTSVAHKIIPFTLYALVFEHIALIELPDATWVWVLAFVLYDFCYYWNHRLGHEVNILWAAHVVHHSSEEYNLTTALRQSSSSLFGWIFYLPMALIGIEPAIMIAVGALNLIYQFWVHTRHVPKLGPLEWIFVTPSNHRVHHAQNQVYIDRNYGGVFIIWDRLFGSFQEELDNEPPIYGIRKALHSWNPLWANVHVYSQLAKDCWRTQRWQDKLGIWFRRTGWRPADMEQKYPLPRADLTKFKKFDTPMSLPTKIYSVLQHAMTILITFLFMASVEQISMGNQWLIMLFVLLSSFGVGALMEGRSFASWLEGGKNLLVFAALYIYSLPVWFSYTMAVGTALSLALLVVLGRSKLPSPDPLPTQN